MSKSDQFHRTHFFTVHNISVAPLRPPLAGDAVEEHARGEAFVIVGAAPVLRGALEAEVVVEAPVAVGVGKEERARRPGFAEAFDRAGDKGAADAEAAGALESAGVSAEPNAEMAVCLIMCATDAAAQGKTDEATRFTIRARDLVGAPAAKALIQLVREADAELRAEREGAAPAGAAGVSATDGAAEEGNQDA